MPASSLKQAWHQVNIHRNGLCSCTGSVADEDTAHVIINRASRNKSIHMLSLPARSENSRSSRRVYLHIGLGVSLCAHHMPVAALRLAVPRDCCVKMHGRRQSLHWAPTSVRLPHKRRKTNPMFEAWLAHVCGEKPTKQTTRDKQNAYCRLKSHPTSLSRLQFGRHASV